MPLQVLASPIEALQRVFGYEAFRPPQDQIIETVLSGRDAFVLMPTGGGKSICYQVPALVQSGTGLVISPLISLMQDQVRALRLNGVEAAFLNSSLTVKEGRDVIQTMLEGQLRLLYVAPERAMMPEFVAKLKQIQLSLVAIDEAHCVSQWGHDFRPEYVRLGELRQQFPSVPFLALTATADEHTRRDIVVRLRLNDPARFVAGFDRPNIRYTIRDKESGEVQLLEFLKARTGESGIVYCLTRKEVESVAAFLSDAGFRAAAYHAGMDNAKRRVVQSAFSSDDLDVVVATVAFGMGIDKPNVRFVVHYEMPKNVESYYQETGRAGRDGLPSEALMLYARKDAMTVRRIIKMGENPEQVKIELTKLQSMVDIAEAATCRRQLLLRYFGEEHPGDCGNCDICLDEPEKYDATAEAGLALMAIYETGQKFGRAYIIDVLTGEGTERLLSYKHDQLPTFGKGGRLSRQEWQNVLTQLVQLGYLRVDSDNYSILKLTPLTRGVLRDGETVLFAKPKRQPRKRKPRKPREPRHVRTADPNLLALLKSWRRETADEQGVPAFVVFSDATLEQIAAKKPITKSALLSVSGVGEYKAEKYGEELIALIGDF